MQPHLYCTIRSINTNYIKGQLDPCQIMVALWLKSLGPWTYFASIIIQISMWLCLILTKCTITVPPCDWQRKNMKQIMEGMLMFARYSLLLGGREGRFVQTWTVLITVCTFPNTSDVTSIDLSYVLIQQMQMNWKQDYDVLPQLICNESMLLYPLWDGHSSRKIVSLSFITSVSYRILLILDCIFVSQPLCPYI